ncbi:MAG: DUF2236 domain-containing protein [Bacteroidetes bacterium]|nr:DUF2236 domain-containing protein [Bacteroidota bacterium]
MTDAFLDAQRQQGDPLADEAIDRLLETEGADSAKALFNQLIGEIEMPEASFPPSMQDFFETTRQLPAEADWQKIRVAQDLFLDHGPKFLVFLYYKSLPQLYCCANGAEVLTRTGRLSRQGDDMEIFARRIAETGQFLMEVMQKGGLQPGGQGIQAIQKVRLIHASIRRFTGRQNWDGEALGVPVNQEDLAVTLMTFSVSMVDALRQFGVAVAPDREEAFYHCWKNIGLLLGCSPEMIPDDLASGRKLLEQILDRQAAPSEPGKLLTKALLNFADHTLKGRLKPVPPFLISELIGQERAQMLDIQPPAGCLGIWLPAFLSSLLQLGERLEDKFEGPMDLLIEELGRQTVKAMVGYFDKFEKRSFAVSGQMTRRWNM